MRLAAPQTLDRTSEEEVVLRIAPRITTRFVIVLAIASAAIAIFVVSHLAGRDAGALVDATMTVNTTVDHAGFYLDDNVLSLREAIALANGDLNDDELSVAECGQVSPSMIIPFDTCVVTGGLGPGALNTINFSSAVVFPPGSPATINAADQFLLDTDGTTIDASDAGVIIDRDVGQCFSISGNSNTLLGLTIQDCVNGVQISDTNGGDSNVIGGLDAGEANTIIAQLGVDVHSGSNNLIVGNFIGTPDTTIHPLPDWGVDLGCCSSEVRNNVISGNDITGLTIQGDDNLVEDNIIGLDETGTQAVPNGGGMSISSASGNTIRGNTIAANDGPGIFLNGNSGATEDNVIVGNMIGESNGSPFPNDGRGILIQNAATTTVGGSQPDDANIIKNSTDDGVEIVGVDAVGNEVYGNTIINNGTHPDFPAHGVQISTMAADNRIGGVGPGEGNVISQNHSRGVNIFSCLDNHVRGNSIFDNQFGGINVTCIDGVEHNPPTVTATGSASGTASFFNDACLTDNCVVDVYSDGANQGQTFHGSAAVQPDGTWSYPGAVIGVNITATMTDLDGGTTSQFSAPFPYTPATPTPTASPPPTPTPVGQTPTPTPTPTPVGQTPTPTPSATPSPTPGAGLTQGDNDCDGDSDAVDALVSLQQNAGFDPNQQPGCPEVGGAVPAGAPAQLFGDIDCDGDVDAVDALQILRNVAGLPVNQGPNCISIGDLL